MQRIDLHEGSMKAFHPTLQRPYHHTVKTKSDELAPVHTEPARRLSDEDQIPFTPRVQSLPGFDWTLVSKDVSHWISFLNKYFFTLWVKIF